MTSLKLANPVFEYRNKIAALFELDGKITVGNVAQTDDGYSLTIEVADHEKFIALDRVMTTRVRFGNLKLDINLVDVEGGTPDEWLALYSKVFEGNGRVKDIRSVSAMGFERSYVRFVPEVVQFQNDDLGDLNGNWSGLAQDIARTVFANNTHGISFCTADIRENSGEVCPLGVEYAPGTTGAEA